MLFFVYINYSDTITYKSIKVEPTHEPTNEYDNLINTYCYA